MENYKSIIRRSQIFYGIDDNEIAMLLKCVAARQDDFVEGEYIFRMGEAASLVALLLKGSAYVVKEDYDGHGIAVDRVDEGGIFGQAYASARTVFLPVSVMAAEDCQVLFMDYQRIVTFCSLACDFHTRMIQNLMRILAQETVDARRRMEHVTRKTTRDKLKSYLSEQALLRGSRSFEVPCSRQELADYLCVDRSAMCSELGKMKAEGLIRYKKNWFELL